MRVRDEGPIVADGKSPSMSRLREWASSTSNVTSGRTKRIVTVSAPLLRSRESSLRAPDEDQDLLTFTHDHGSRQIAHGESVGVGGGETQAITLGSHQDTGENLTGLIGARSGDDLTKCVGEQRGVDDDGVLGGFRRRWNPWAEIRPDGELRTSRADPGLLVVDLEGDST